MANCTSIVISVLSDGILVIFTSFPIIKVKPANREEEAGAKSDKSPKQINEEEADAKSHESSEQINEQHELEIDLAPAKEEIIEIHTSEITPPEAVNVTEIQDTNKG